MTAEPCSDAARLLLAAQRAEWACRLCQVIHPWRPGDFLSVACPDCGTPMTPTSPALRDLEQARQRLAACEQALAAAAVRAAAAEFERIRQLAERAQAIGRAPDGSTQYFTRLMSNEPGTDQSR